MVFTEVGTIKCSGIARSFNLATEELTWGSEVEIRVVLFAHVSSGVYTGVYTFLLFWCFGVKGNYQLSSFWKALEYFQKYFTEDRMVSFFQKLNCDAKAWQSRKK